MITGRCLHWLGSLRPDWLSGSVCWGTGLDRLHKSVQLLLSTVCSHHVMSIGLLSPCQIWRKVIYKKILNLHHNFHFCLGHLNPKFQFQFFIITVTDEIIFKQNIKKEECYYNHMSHAILLKISMLFWLWTMFNFHKLVLLNRIFSVLCKHVETIGLKTFNKNNCFSWLTKTCLLSNN